MRPSDLQVSYQRNMLYGLLLACLVSIGFGAWIHSLDGTRQGTTSTVTQADNVVVPDRDEAESSEKAVVRNIGGFNPYAAQHEGFLGFRDIRPKPDAPEPTMQPQLAYTHELTPSGFDEGIGTSFSPIEGDDTGVYVPDDYLTVIDEFKPRLVLADRDVEVVYRVDPEYPYVAQDAEKQGQVTVLIYLDSTGTLSSFPDWIGGDGIQTMEFTVKGERKAQESIPIAPPLE